MNIDIYTLLLISLALFLVSAVLSLGAGKRKMLAGWINLIMTGAATIILTIISIKTLGGPESSVEVIQIGILKLSFLIDGISALFLLVIAVPSFIASLYSIKYMDHYEDYKVGPYYGMLSLFIAGMVLLVTVDDLSIGFTIAWQLMTLTSFYLVRYESRKEENRKAALRYLLLMEGAWAAITTGSVIISKSFNGMDLHHITGHMSDLSIAGVYVAVGLILVGFACKAAIFPMGQMWLPGAHSVAPAPVSALLSGVMLKTGIYGIIRTLFWMKSATLSLTVLGWIIAFFGTVTLLIGTIQSMKQNDGKRLLAYSSIGQLGYIVLAVGAAAVFSDEGSTTGLVLAGASMMGALLHMFNHAVFKGLLFLTSGSVLYRTNEKDLSKLGGLMVVMPFTAMTAAIASISIAGMPPFSGFASKWAIIVPGLTSGTMMPPMVIFGIIALFTGTLTLACYIKYFGMTFGSTGLEDNKDIRDVPFSMKLPVALMTILCIIQGLAPVIFYDIIQKGLSASSLKGMININGLTANWKGLSLGAPGPLAFVSPLIITVVLLTGLAVAIIMKRNAMKDEKKIDPWLCGYQTPHSMNRYRGQNLFAPLKQIFKWAGGNEGGK